MRTFEKGFEIGLGDAISNSLVSGEWKKNNAAEIKLLKAPEKLTGEEEVALMVRNLFIRKGVFEPFFIDFGNETSRSQDEVDFYNFYRETRSKYIHGLSQHSTLIEQIHLETIQNTNITLVHEYAEMQFDHFSRELGRQLFGSKEYWELGMYADYWSRAEQIARGAVEYKIRNGLSD
jgi:hypothetical protein